jgi:hypothetical protein
MRAVAAGHPATAEVGAEILAEGGNAADAAVAATLASCVAETVMTGLLGAGMGSISTRLRGRARNLDCFVAVPGLGSESRDVSLLELDVPFGTELVHYAVGIGSCGCPEFRQGSTRFGTSTADCPGRVWSSPRSASHAVRSRCLPRMPPACGCWSR